MLSFPLPPWLEAFDSKVIEWSGELVARPALPILAIALPLALLALLFRIHPAASTIRWAVLMTAASIGATGDARLTGPATAAAVVLSYWVVYDRFPRLGSVTRRLAARIAAGSLLAALVGFVTASGSPSLIVFFDGTLLAAASIDLLLLSATILIVRRRFSAERKVLKIASLRKRHDVELTLDNRSRFTFHLDLIDDLDQSWSAEPASFGVRLKPRTRLVLTYRFRPSRRGKFSLDGLHLKLRSPLDFWWRYSKYPIELEVYVYPDMAQLRDYAILARTNRLSLLGVRRTRKVGQDNEFERLRDYTPDDNFRHMDWRATARRNRLTVRDFQVNQSQRLIFLIDCGRMMSNEAAGIPMLDHAINAMLMASYVALRQGDSVGLLCFSDRIHAYVPPRGGMRQMNQLLHAVFDRHAALVESRYDEAFLHLRTQCPKRSLVVLMTNVVDEVNAAQVSQYLSSLVGRHLPLGVLMRDHRLFDRADRRAETRSEVFQAAAAAEILDWRHQVLVDMTHKGVLALDVFPEDMTAPLVNQYLQIKARHLL